MDKINCKCNGCGKIHSVDRTEEIPEDVVSLVCNWCPICDDTAKDYYMEEYRYYEVEEKKDINQQALEL